MERTEGKSETFFSNAKSSTNDKTPPGTKHTLCSERHIHESRIILFEGKKK
jgi:hypothetical protein